MSSDTIPIDPNAFLPNDDSTTTTTIPPSILIGWFAALIGALGFGSFAVPIKGDAANSVDVDPLVMQSYKSLMCFLSSWLVLLCGECCIGSCYFCCSMDDYDVSSHRSEWRKRSLLTRDDVVLTLRTRTHIHLVGNSFWSILGPCRSIQHLCNSECWIGCESGDCLFVYCHGEFKCWRSIVLVVVLPMLFNPTATNQCALFLPSLI